MGKLIYGFNVSLDGYIADARGNIDWSEPGDELHQYWNDFERETSLSFYGRRLYELMSAYWPTADQAPDAPPLVVDFARIWCDMPKVVFSRTMQSVDWNSRLERGDPVEVVRKLKAETDGRLEVASATLAVPVVQAGLVDEYRAAGRCRRGRRRRRHRRRWGNWSRWGQGRRRRQLEPGRRRDRCSWCPRRPGWSWRRRRIWGRGWCRRYGRPGG